MFRVLLQRSRLWAHVIFLTPLCLFQLRLVSILIYLFPPHFSPLLLVFFLFSCLSFLTVLSFFLPPRFSHDLLTSSSFFSPHLLVFFLVPCLFFYYFFSFYLLSLLIYLLFISSLFFSLFSNICLISFLSSCTSFPTSFYYPHLYCLLPLFLLVSYCLYFLLRLFFLSSSFLFILSYIFFNSSARLYPSSFLYGRWKSKVGGNYPYELLSCRVSAAKQQKYSEKKNESCLKRSNQ